MSPGPTPSGYSFTDLGGFVFSPFAPELAFMATLANELYERVGGMAQGLWNTVRHPLQTFDSVVETTANFMTIGMSDRDSSGWGGFGNGVMSLWEGAGYLVGSSIGVKNIGEAWKGVDLMTSQELTGEERWVRGLSGFGQLLLTGAGIGKAYTSPVNRLANEVFDLQSFRAGGYGFIRAEAIAERFGIGSVSNLKIGQAGEFLAGRHLLKNGVTDLAQIQNTSGHGIDLTGIGTNGRMFAEVKSSRGVTAPRLTPAQRNIDTFVSSRLRRAAGVGRDAWPVETVSPATRALADRALREIRGVSAHGQVLTVTNLGGIIPRISTRTW
jgi:hypothetical protein